MKKFYLALDLADDADLIRQYEDHHKPENERKAITESIRSAGITNMEIFRTGNRLFMIMETADDFDFTRKAQMDADNAEAKKMAEKTIKEQGGLTMAQIADGGPSPVGPLAERAGAAVAIAASSGAANRRWALDMMLQTVRFQRKPDVIPSVGRVVPPA